MRGTELKPRSMASTEECFRQAGQGFHSLFHMVQFAGWSGRSSWTPLSLVGEPQKPSTNVWDSWSIKAIQDSVSDCCHPKTVAGICRDRRIEVLDVVPTRLFIKFKMYSNSIQFLQAPLLGSTSRSSLPLSHSPVASKRVRVFISESKCIDSASDIFGLVVSALPFRQTAMRWRAAQNSWLTQSSWTMIYWLYRLYII